MICQPVAYTGAVINKHASSMLEYISQDGDVEHDNADDTVESKLFSFNEGCGGSNFHCHKNGTTHVVVVLRVHDKSMAACFARERLRPVIAMPPSHAQPPC